MKIKCIFELSHEGVTHSLPIVGHLFISCINREYKRRTVTTIGWLSSFFIILLNHIHESKLKLPTDCSHLFHMQMEIVARRSSELY
jgi:hypothetical protein